MDEKLCVNCVYCIPNENDKNFYCNFHEKNIAYDAAHEFDEAEDCKQFKRP